MITLAIIGIVAAMAVPNLVSKYQKHLWVTQAKRAYSLLSNRTKIVLAEKGCETLSCAYANPTLVRYNDKGGIVWQANDQKAITAFVYDLFPDAEKTSGSVFRNDKMYGLNGKTSYRLSQMSDYDSYAHYKLPKANMLLICEDKSFSNYYDIYPDTFINPDLGRLKQRGFCAVVTKYPSKKYILGRNIFILAFLEDGRWVARAPYFKNPTYCKTTSGGVHESCFSKMQMNGWQMDY